MIIKFDIPVFQRDLIFSAVRSKRDLSCILLECIKIMSLPPLIIKEEQKYGELLFVKKGGMSRIFLVSDGKIVSFGVPFLSIINEAYENYKVIDFYWADKKFVDNKLTSIALNFIKGGYLDDDLKFDRFADYLLEQEVDFDVFWDFIKILMSSECGYIRYDYDPDPERLKESDDKGYTHPLNHFDLFYSSFNGIKVGLYEKMDFDKIFNVFDAETDCHYLKSRV